jgi:hypothetical protein
VSCAFTTGFPRLWWLKQSCFAIRASFTQIKTYHGKVSVPTLSIRSWTTCMCCVRPRHVRHHECLMGDHLLAVTSMLLSPTHPYTPFF